MPKGEVFWNPYRMIPVRGGEVKRKQPLTDQKFQGKSGVLTCSLENLTPLFIGGNRDFKENFMTRGGKPVIPGSSLKGMLRSLCEIVGGGCMVTNNMGNQGKVHAACSQAHKLCIACRIFGMMERGRNARVHKGNIGIGDALVREDKPVFNRFQVLMSNCGTRHEPFYRSQDSGRLDWKSRKLYFHQVNRKDSVPPVPENLQSRAWYINALLPGHHFDFTVQFSNFTDEELSLLIYALVLEESAEEVLKEGEIRLKGPMRHKIGNAKPLGLGSCRVKLKKLVYFAEPEKRFASIGKCADRVFESADLDREIKRNTQYILGDTSETMRQLRKMMIWDEKDERVFRYPDYYWFKSPQNSGKPLKDI